MEGKKKSFTSKVVHYGKMTGKQMFFKDAKLIKSDEALAPPDADSGGAAAEAVAVDAEAFEDMDLDDLGELDDLSEEDD